MKFFKGKCGTVVTKLFETECEGGPLEELIPNTTDAAGEKHVPVISVNGQEVTVKVGEVAHPMRQGPPSMGFSRQNTGVNCHFLLQGIFPTQGLNPGLLYCRQTLLSEPPGKPQDAYIYF